MPADDVAGQPIAIIAGHGRLPVILSKAAVTGGRLPVVFAISGEADAELYSDFTCHPVRWGEIGKLFDLIKQHDCREVVMIGSVRKRPDFAAVRPDLGTVRLLPRIMKMMLGGDDSVLQGAAKIFRERGVELVTPLDLAPDLAMPAGQLTRRALDSSESENLERASEAARAIGKLDIGQAAVAVGGRVVALEGVEGTDGLLNRIAALREDGRLPKKGGTLVKCMKPNQDPRLDLPTIGPATAELAAAAGLSGVAAEAGRALLAGRSETIDAFDKQRLFLIGIPQV